MAIRFRRTIRLAPGLRLNVGKRGISLSTGVRGASFTLGKRGAYSNLGLPGSGLSVRQRLDAPASRSKTANRGDSRQIEHLQVHISLDEDGSLLLRRDTGEPLPPEMLRLVRRQQPEVLQEALEKHCNEINDEIDGLLILHHSTPTPDCATTWQIEPFEEPAPERPKPRPHGVLGWLFRSYRRRVNRENRETQERYRQQRDAWELRRDAHDEERIRLQSLLSHGRLQDLDAMEEVLKIVLGRIAWPRETNVDFDIGTDGAHVCIDVDLPEIEDMPRKWAKVAGRLAGVRYQAISNTEIRRSYMTHVHSVAFRIIGEVFAALPNANAIMLSGYSQRPDPGTGQITDEYLYSVRVQRSDWCGVNFSDLRHVDPVEALSRFDLRRRMTRSGIFKSIDPFKPEDTS